MKTAVLNFLVTTCISSILFAADSKPAPDAAVVSVLNKPLPSEKDEKFQFLWNIFANKPDEQKFDLYTTEKWQDSFEAFAAALIKKADDQKLDSVSLGKALNLVLKDSKTAENEIAYLPIAAYQTTLEGRPVWIIIVKWEYPSMGRKRGGIGLGHIRAFVFDQDTMKQVGFMTCG